MFPSDDGRWTFTASGSSGTFNVNAPVYDTAALALYAVDSDNVIYNPAFTVVLAADRSGATVAVASGLTSGDRVVVCRVPKLTQLEPLPASGPLPAWLVGRQLDRAFADLMALHLRSQRSIRAPLADDDALDELPAAALRANGIVGFDALGALAVIFQVPLSPVVNVSAFMQTLLLAASAGAVRNTLGFSSWFQTLIATTDAASLVAAIGATDLRDELDVERANGKSIRGLVLAKNGANTIDLTAGGAMSDDGTTWLAYAGGTALDISTLFAGGGLLDTGAIGNANYCVWLVGDGTQVKPLLVLETDAPIMPSGYTLKAKVNWLKRSGGAIVLAHQMETAGGGLWVEWDTPILDITLLNTLTTTRRTDALQRVPLAFSVFATINVEAFDPSATLAVDVYSPARSGMAIALSSGVAATAPIGATATVTAGNSQYRHQLRVRTSAAGEIAAEANTTVNIYQVSTVGFEWSRR